MAVRDFLEGAIRREMKKRIDQILEAGKDWSTTAKELTDALVKLAEAIEKSEEKPDIPNIKKSVVSLSRKTSKLTKTFMSFEKTLLKIMKGA